MLESLRGLGYVPATALADHLGVDGPASLDFLDEDIGGGLMASFAPRNAEDPVPTVLDSFDTTADWEPRGTGVSEITHANARER